MQLRSDPLVGSVVPNATLTLPGTVRSDVLVVGVVPVVTGVAVLAVAFATSVIGWLLVELPGAANDITRSLTLMLLGWAFVALAVVGVTVVGRRPPASSRRTMAALLVGLASLGVAVLGAGRFASWTVAEVLRPVLGADAYLRVPEGDSGVIVLVGLALAVASLLVVVLPGRDVGPRS